MPEVPNVLRVTVDLDPSPENPAKQENEWTVYSFGDNDIITDCDRSDFFDEDTGEPHDPELAAKLANGLAFGCEYEDGNECSTTLSDDTENGLIVWENDEDAIGGKTVEERRKDAENFLKRYSNWQNGYCYVVKVEKIKSVAPDYDPEDDSHNGAFWENIHGEDAADFFYGDADVKEFVRGLEKQFPGAKIVRQGECTFILDYPD